MSQVAPQSIRAHQPCVFLGMQAVVVSEPMLRLLDTVERVARSTATVLIHGESGTGKELVARAVHHLSMRSQKPWVDLSCAALPEHLLESELFGYEKGAFSSADSAKPGLFEMAHQGTIFLDEIAELDLRMQVKLLRVLDGVPYYRLGGVKKVSVDVRVVAATNQDLEAAVAAGKFRSDLYHRLSQITLNVPPLRHRVADIGPLAQFFLEQQDGVRSFSPQALALLEQHSWAGNIRELRNVVIKAALMARGDQIEPQDLPLRQAGGAPRLESNGAGHAAGLGHPADLDRPASLDSMEQRMILDALQATGGHQQRAAARLGISRRTLSRKLKLYENEGLRQPV